MNKISLYMKHPLKNLSVISYQFQIRLKSNKQDKDDQSKNISEKKATNKEALDKLNLLLTQIVQDEGVKTTSNLELAKPKPKRKVQKQSKELKTESVEKQTVEQKVISSVKLVAESLGGDTKQTESELLSKLLNSMNPETETKIPATSLSDIVKGMKIDRSSKSAETVSRAQQVRNILNATKDSNISEGTQRKFSRRQPRDVNQLERREKKPINLFGNDNLGIFSEVGQYVDTVVNKTWEKLHERDLRLAITHPPSNYFQQMILWTNEGKLWKFPIDNEQGLEEEKNVYFADHVFLEKHLEPWCPPKGPIRHFMELVCVGLSKNPYMTVTKKQDHIGWYREYFEGKQKLLVEVGAVSSDFQLEKKSATTENTEN